MKWPRIYYNIYTLKYEFVLEEITKQSNQLVFNVDELFANLDKGKDTIEAVDWLGEIWEIVKINNSMDMFEQSYCWIYPLLSRVRDYDVRIEVLENLKKYSLWYLETFDKMYRFIDDCNAMITIIEQLKQFPVPDYMLREQKYDEKQWMKELTLVYTKTTLAPSMLMALAQERYNIDIQKKKVDKLSSIVLSLGYLQKFTIANCIDFCKYLFVAEGYRQFLICGDPDYDEAPTLKTLDRKLRNACFDIYIQSRYSVIKNEMDDDNTRLFDPSENDIYDRFYEEEKEVINHECQKEFANREVLQLAKYLLRYIEVKMQKLKMTDTSFKWTEDIGQGDKHVDIHIEHVENMATGDNVQTKIVQNHE